MIRHCLLEAFSLYCEFSCVNLSKHFSEPQFPHPCKDNSDPQCQVGKQSQAVTKDKHMSSARTVVAPLPQPSLLS